MAPKTKVTAAVAAEITKQALDHFLRSGDYNGVRSSALVRHLGVADRVLAKTLSSLIKQGDLTLRLPTDSANP